VVRGVRTSRAESAPLPKNRERPRSSHASRTCARGPQAGRARRTGLFRSLRQPRASPVLPAWMGRAPGACAQANRARRAGSPRPLREPARNPDARTRARRAHGARQHDVHGARGFCALSVGARAVGSAARQGIAALRETQREPEARHRRESLGDLRGHSSGEVHPRPRSEVERSSHVASLGIEDPREREREIECAREGKRERAHDGEDATERTREGARKRRHASNGARRTSRARE